MALIPRRVAKAVTSRSEPLTGKSINGGASVFSHLLEEMAHVIQTTDEGQLQCLTIEFALPAGR
jgi:hypothetical protein